MKCFFVCIHIYVYEINENNNEIQPECFIGHLREPLAYQAKQLAAFCPSLHSGFRFC